MLVVDRRDHVGGNAHDHLDAAGVLVHRYGPHIFHTNSEAVFDYLSRFTAWRPYEHRVQGFVDGMLVPIPINLDTVNQLYGLNLTSGELEDWFTARAEPVTEARTSEDVIVSRIGRELYQKFFQNYTRKQWGLDPSQLDRSVTARVPVRTNRDDRYFTDRFQAMPRDGYTRMFERMLDHPNITVRAATDYSAIKKTAQFRRLVWTGPVDEFFGHRFGRLPYRSLRFRHETLNRYAVPACRYGELPADGGFHARHGIQAPDRANAPLHQRDVPGTPPPKAIPTTPFRGRRTKRSTDVTKSSQTPSLTRGLSAGSQRIATSTWIRWSVRRSPPSAASRSEYPAVAKQGGAWRPACQRRPDQHSVPTARGGSPLRLWGGFECSVVRIGHAWRDQVRETGHHDRGARDLDQVAALGIRTLRYPVLWERVTPGQAGASGWAWHDRQLEVLRQRGIATVAGLLHHGSGPRGTELLGSILS